MNKTFSLIFLIETLQNQQIILIHFKMRFDLSYSSVNNFTNLATEQKSVLDAMMNGEVELLSNTDFIELKMLNFITWFMSNFSMGFICGHLSNSENAWTHMNINVAKKTTLNILIDIFIPERTQKNTQIYRKQSIQFSRCTVIT